MSLRATIRAAISATLRGSADFAEAKFDLPFHSEIALASGVGSYQADVIFSDQRTIAASGDEDLDLSGALANAIGGAAVFAKVKAILIRAAAGNTNNVEVSPDGSAGFLGPFGDASDVISIPPGGAFMVAAPAAGWAVTATTADLLNIANSGAGTSVTYDVVILGTSA